MRRGEGFEQERFGCFRVSHRAQKEIERMAEAQSTARYRYTHCFLTLMYVSSTRHESVVDFRMRAATFVQFRRVALGESRKIVV